MRHLRLLEQAASKLEIPVIASLNATHSGSWERQARMMAEAGADALDLNLYTVAADPVVPAGRVEERQLEIISSVANSVDIPLALKVSPYYTSFAQFAAAATRAGARGLVVFNSFCAPASTSTRCASTRRPPCRTRKTCGCRCAGSPSCEPSWRTRAWPPRPVHGWEDVVKALLVGADVACTTAAVIQRVPGVITGMLDGVRR